MREKRGLKEVKKERGRKYWGVAKFRQEWEWEMEEKIEFMEKTNQRYV